MYQENDIIEHLQHLVKTDDSPEAAAFLGSAAYVKGQYEEAVKWLQIGVDRKSAIAMSMLAEIFMIGQGVSQDIQGAINLLKKASALGHSESQYELGLHYLISGLPQKAMRYLFCAAMRKDNAAQCLLGQMFENGETGSRNIVVAFAWFSIAVYFGNDAAGDLLEPIFDEITPEQIVEAEALIAKLFPELTPQNKVETEHTDLIYNPN